MRRNGGGWEAWICCHPLDVPGEEDRMTTAYATSDDGLAWEWHGTALAPRRGAWDARGARLTALLPGRHRGLRRAGDESRELPRAHGVPSSAGRRLPPVADVRYLDVLPLEGGGWRLFYEAPLPDGSHALRTEFVSA